ncbi:hypothetical protein [Anaerosinus gibii]|uniref:DUF2953 domain-containing protein n=1 Tax=Selenobaculum gibii TaxID=3054208 RepID=A0A9Y2ADQ3_9FIRM|nr:hypothetical protein [Selenobaculum gbiensis]WIW69640.1 hypothetical protein P3F81_06835 [Selenobaculum gbiensis]
MKYLLIIFFLLFCAWFFIKINLSIKYVKNSTEDLLTIKILIFNIRLYEKIFSPYLKKIYEKFLLKKLKKQQLQSQTEDKSKDKNWSEIKDIFSSSLYRTQNEKNFGNFKHKFGFKKGKIKICYSCYDPAITSITYGVLNSLFYTCFIHNAKYLNIEIQPNFIVQQLFVDAECIFTFTFGDFICMIRNFKQEAKK